MKGKKIETIKIALKQQDLFRILSGGEEERIIRVGKKKELVVIEICLKAEVE